MRSAHDHILSSVGFALRPHYLSKVSLNLHQFLQFAAAIKEFGAVSHLSFSVDAPHYYVVTSGTKVCILGVYFIVYLNYLFDIM